MKEVPKKKEIYLLQLNINLHIESQKVDYTLLSRDLARELRVFNKKISIDEYPVTDSDPQNITRLMITVGNFLKITFSKIKIEIWTKPERDFPISFLERIINRFKIQSVGVVRVLFVKKEYLLPKLKEKMFSNDMDINEFNSISLRFSKNTKELDLDIIKTESIMTKSISINEKKTEGYILTNSHETARDFNLATKKEYRNNNSSYVFLINHLISSINYSITNLL